MALWHRARAAVRDIYCGVIHNTPLFDGQSIYESEWDLVIVLDACRPDALREVMADYDWLPKSINTRYSVASTSMEWLERTFSDDYAAAIRETAYITANAHSASCLSARQFAHLDAIWRMAFDTNLGTVPPRPVTDRAIASLRADVATRYIVHYMQPHFPSIPDPLGFGIQVGAPASTERSEWIWADGKPTGYSRERLWDAYIANLRYVLDEVELLLNNAPVDRAVITADHGNAFGEWGLWGHPRNRPLPVLRRVPWVSVPATDTENYQPDTDTPNHEGTPRAEQLRALGYRHE